MARVTTEVKELRAFLKGRETIIESQRTALGNLHKTVLENTKKIELLEYQNKEYKSVIHYLEFKLGQMAKVNDGK
jgi:hypothetical protein